MIQTQQPVAPAPPAIPQAAQDAARQARQEAQQAVKEALAEQGAAADAGRTFRIQGADGKVVTLGPEGVVVTQSGQTVPPDFPVIPQEAVVISIAFFAMIVLVLVGWPIARAIARRMDRAPTPPAHLPAEQTEQLRRIEQAVEAMAIEVERVSENQRFVTKLLSERQPDGALLAAAERGRGVAERALPDAPPPR